MPGLDDKSLDGEDPLEPPSPPQIPLPVHIPMHIYPFPGQPLPQQPPVRSKRRQVKNACTNCQKACKKCDDARPCLRCVKYGISEECVDSQRKERKKGIKRGPYKKRDGKGRAANSVESTVRTAQHTTTTTTSASATVIAPTEGSPIPASYMPLAYPTPFYPQYPPATPPKAGDSPTAYPSPYYLTPVPHVQPHVHGVQDGDATGYPHPQAFYPTAVYAPVSYHQAHYTTIPRSDPHATIHPHYAPYATTPYTKPTPADISNGIPDRLHHAPNGVAGKAG